MVWLLIIVLVVLVIWFIVLLYGVGKAYKEREAEFNRMFEEAEVQRRLSSYNRKSTPKTPSIKSLKK